MRKFLILISVLVLCTAFVSAVPQHPNEPNGYTRFLEWDASESPGTFSEPCSSSSLLEGCGIGGTGSNLDYVNDSTAPISPPGVWQVTYPEGMSPGTSPGLVNQIWENGEEVDGEEYREFYQAAWFKFHGPNGSADFELPSPGMKLFGYFGSGSPSSENDGAWQNFLIILNDEPGTTNIQSRFHVQFNQQDILANEINQNVNLSKVATAGQWHLMEFVARINDIGSANGELHVWIDDTKIIESDDVIYRTEEDPRLFFGRRWDPVWGGTGGIAKTRNDYLKVDHVYMSGIPRNASTNTTLSNKTRGQTSNQTFAKEDVNSDGNVNIFDLVQVARNIGSGDSGLDLNDDGTVNVFDLITIVQSIVGSGSSGSGGVPVPEMPGHPTFQEVSDGVNVSWGSVDNAEKYTYTSAVENGETTQTRVVLPLNDGDWFCVKAVNSEGEEGEQACDTYSASSLNDSVDSNASSENVSGLYPHEPAGMEKIFQADGTTKSFDGWYSFHGWGNDSRVFVLSDENTSAPPNPLGSGSVIKYVVPEGEAMSGRTTLASFSDVNASPVSELYIMFRVFLSDPYDTGHGQKFWYWGMNAPESNSAPITGWMSRSVAGDGLSGVLSTGFYPDGNAIDPRPEQIWTPGEWHNVEIHIVSESEPGAEDGEVYWWIDGEMIGNNTAAKLTGSDWSDTRIDGFRWVPHSNDANNFTDYLLFGELYLSGK